MTTKTAPRATSAAGTSPPGSGRMKLSAVRRGVRSAPDKTAALGRARHREVHLRRATPPNRSSSPPRTGSATSTSRASPSRRASQDVLDAVRTLTTEPHEYETLVIDTIDWVEPLIHDAVCQANGWKSIEDPGYGRGHAVALVEWRKLLAALDRLRAERGMEIILLAHTTIRTFANPAGSNYDRYELKLQRSAAALVKEWVGREPLRDPRGLHPGSAGEEVEGLLDGPARRAHRAHLGLGREEPPRAPARAPALLRRVRGGPRGGPAGRPEGAAPRGRRARGAGSASTSRRSRRRARGSTPRPRRARPRSRKAVDRLRSKVAAEGRGVR